MQPIQLMIAGAQKAGTSSLHYYLSQHPDICTHDQLEMMYFAADSIYAKGYRTAFERYYQCEDDNGQIILAKNVGIMYLPQAMQRLYKHNPNVQIIISLRNPVDRAYSAYWYARQMGWETMPTFEEAIEADPDRFANDQIRFRGCAYIDRGNYAKYLDLLYEIFNRDQVQIFLLDDIKDDPNSICRQIYNSVGLDSSYIPTTKERKNLAASPRYKIVTWLLSSNQSIPSTFREISRDLFPDRFRDSVRMNLGNINKQRFHPLQMQPDTRRTLIQLFEPHNAKLSEMISRDLSYWNH